MSKASTSISADFLLEAEVTRVAPSFGQRVDVVRD